MNKREAAIVSCYTGKLIGTMIDIYEYLGELSGSYVFTHQIPMLLEMYAEEIKKDFISIEVV